MTATNHKPTKRRNLTRWMESRLRRIDAKITTSPTQPWMALYNDLSPESLARCRERGHRLATDIQAIWAKKHADKIRAILNT